MGSIFKAYATSKTAEEDGVWFDNFGVKGVRMKLRRYTSRRSTAVKSEIEQQNFQLKEKGVFPHDVAEQMVVEHLAKGVVVAWEGVVDDDGNALPLSECERVLNALPDLAVAVLTRSVEMTNFQNAREKAAEKNS